MESTTEKPKTADLKPGAKPESKDDLKSLPMAEVEKKLSFPQEFRQNWMNWTKKERPTS
jgi:hypothetical protein